MSKYKNLKIWVMATAKTPKNCSNCKHLILPDESYHSERLKDSKINFIGKKLCKTCGDLVKLKIN